ncbi:hypothetical protein Nepgr_029726 [Nepenthes gracilis]|uniref:Uncharacterized protein n=1 Tax=Nepenthes gracilis TaxID=150966 RepID=A0AAD3Y3I0_NEPGR|nr:hypothetical protein Nepgr_029726 [Nepenthes gracilis]
MHGCCFVGSCQFDRFGRFVAFRLTYFVLSPPATPKPQAGNAISRRYLIPVIGSPVEQLVVDLPFKPSPLLVLTPSLLYVQRLSLSPLHAPKITILWPEFVVVAAVFQNSHYSMA